MFGKKKQRIFETSPDQPLAFGYKSCWIALKNADPAEIKNSLLGYYGSQWTAYEANWESGFAAVLNDDYGYVLPAVEGWTLIWDNGINNIAEVKTQELLSRWSGLFGCAYYFATHRGTGYGAAAVFQNTDRIRAFSFGDGEIGLNIGPKTPTELRVIQETQGTDKIDPEMTEYYASLDNLPILAAEESIIELAAEWSINPLKLNEYASQGIGLAYERGGRR